MPRTGRLQQLRSAVARAFFANFFRLLLVAVSAAQLAVLWWFFRETAATLPAAALVAIPAGLYGFNRWLAARGQHQRRRRRPPGALPRLYHAVAFTCLFCAAFLATTGILWAGARAVLGAMAVEARSSAAGVDMYRRLDTGFRWFAHAGVALIGLSFLYGYTIGQRRLRVRRVVLSPRDWPAGLDRLRVAHISDIHIGQNLRVEELERFVARVNALGADLVCVTGDIVDSPSADLAAFLPVLGRIEARHGVCAILGNHDHYAGADRVEAALRRHTDFTVLRDAAATIRIGDARLHVVGLDDRGRDWARGLRRVPELGALLATLPPDDPVLLLTHRPDVFPQAAGAGVPLTLAGHTHGGQIGIPWFGGRVRNLAEFVTPFDRGLFERDGRYLYVNCGLGVTAQRIRLSTPREITLLELRRPTVAGPAGAPS